jgi:hypothetical protein
MTAKINRRGFLGATAALGAARMIGQFGCAPLPVAIFRGAEI